MTFRKSSLVFWKITQGSSLYWGGITQLHPLSSNPNEWKLCLSTQRSTSIYPALDWRFGYIQTFRSQLHGLGVSSWPSDPKQE